jgi:hypothetical protein
MDITEARTTPFIAMTGAFAALLAIMSLAPADAERLRYRNTASAVEAGQKVAATNVIVGTRSFTRSNQVVSVIVGNRWIAKMDA